MPAQSPPYSPSSRRTTNHLERLDPALSRPGRMDVWIEFKNASKWQAELLFRNFFPSTDEDDVPIEGDLDSIELPTTPPSPSAGSSSSSTLFSSMASAFSSVPASPSGSASPLSPLPSMPDGLPMRERTSSTAGQSPRSGKDKARSRTVSDVGLQNQAYQPPPVEDEIMEAKHSAKPLDGATLAKLAKQFADAIPNEEFSVAALQGCECPTAFICQVPLFVFPASFIPHPSPSSFLHMNFVVLLEGSRACEVASGKRTDRLFCGR